MRELPFAQAERLALYARDTFNASPATVLDVLCGWRDRNAVDLTDDALAMVAAHVTKHTGAVRESVAV